MPRGTPSSQARLQAVQPQRVEPYESINHPPHYTPSTIECIDALKVILTPEEYVGFLRGTVIKYQWRLGRKPGTDMLSDTQKCQWYMQKLEEELAGSPVDLE